MKSIKPIQKRCFVKSILILSLAVLFVFPAALSGYADAGQKYTCWTEENAPHNLWRKGGRGISNAGLGWLELIHQPIYLSERGNRLPIAISGGILKGAFFTVVRAVTGVYEIVTFPFPIPWGYRPIVYPEFALPHQCERVGYEVMG